VLSYSYWMFIVKLWWNLLVPMMEAGSHPEKQENVQCKKVEVLLRPTGDAPILKRKKWQVDPSQTVQWVIQFLRKLLKCEQADSLFLYVNQAFAPSPDREIGSLYECFGVDGKLVLHYAKTQAWGWNIMKRFTLLLDLHCFVMKSWWWTCGNKEPCLLNALWNYRYNYITVFCDLMLHVVFTW